MRKMQILRIDTYNVTVTYMLHIYCYPTDLLQLGAPGQKRVTTYPAKTVTHASGIMAQIGAGRSCRMGHTKLSSERACNSMKKYVGIFRDIFGPCEEYNDNSKKPVVYITTSNDEDSAIEQIADIIIPKLSPKAFASYTNSGFFKIACGKYSARQCIEILNPKEDSSILYAKLIEWINKDPHDGIETKRLFLNFSDEDKMFFLRYEIKRRIIITKEIED